MQILFLQVLVRFKQLTGLYPLSQSGAPVSLNYSITTSEAKAHSHLRTIFSLNTSFIHDGRVIFFEI